MCLTSILLDPDEPYLTTSSALVLSEVVGAGKVGRRCSVAVANCFCGFVLAVVFCVFVSLARLQEVTKRYQIMAFTSQIRCDISKVVFSELKDKSDSQISDVATKQAT